MQIKETSKSFISRMEYILRRHQGQETQHGWIVSVTASGVVPSIPIWRDSAAEWHQCLPQKYRSHQQWQLPHWLLRSIWCYLYLLAIKRHFNRAMTIDKKLMCHKFHHMSDSYVIQTTALSYTKWMGIEFFGYKQSLDYKIFRVLE